MYTHIDMPLDFRLSAWPYGGNRYVTTYNTDRYRIDIRAILDYVETELRKMPTAFVLKTTFTLLNVYSEFTDTSVGISMEPDKSIRRGMLTFTFARTRNEDVQKPQFVQWRNTYTCQWGCAANAPIDFITVNVPINVATRARIQQMTELHQRNLFDIVGGYTKAVIRSIKDRNTSVDIMRNYKYYTIPRAMFYLGLGDWKYVLEFWKRMPDLLRVEWSAKFTEYYVREIAADLPDYQRSPFYAQYAEECQDRLRQFILRYLQNKVRPDEANLVALLPADDMLIHDVESLVANLAKGIIE